MYPLLENQVNEILERPMSDVELGSERSLRVAAATLAEARPADINATRVVGVLQADDAFAFESHVARLAEEFDLDARVRLADGGFSVRFSRPNDTI